MIDFIRAKYSLVDGCTNVFKNNIKEVQGQYRLWRYVFDYIVEEPKLDPVPVKIKSKEGLSLFRYMRASNFLADLQSQQLTFISPGLWEDPFEQLFFRDSGIKIGDTTYYIRCICFTYDWIESEEAAWLRSGENSEVVRVEYDFEKLCSELNKIKDAKFFFSVVDYSLPRKEIVKQSNAFEGGKWKPNSIDEYLNVMSLKRKAFTYENEIRLFMVKEQSIDGDITCLSYCDSPIVSVCLPPKRLSPIELVEQAEERYGIEVQHSHLYDLG